MKSIPVFVIVLGFLLHGELYASLKVEGLYRFGWGSAVNQIGRVRPSEGNPEGPMAISIDKEGTIFILDQVNFRILVIPKIGNFHAIPIPSNTFQDILALDGKFALLDRLFAKVILIIDMGGKVLSEIPIEGRGVPFPGAVTGLVAQLNGIYLEVDRLWTVRVADMQGKPDLQRPILAGIIGFSNKASYRAGIGEGNSCVITEFMFTRREKPRLFAKVEFPVRPTQIDSFGITKTGYAFLAVRLEEESSEPKEMVVVLDETAKEVGRVSLPGSNIPEEQMKPIKLGHDDTMYLLILDEKGGTIWRVSL